MQTSIRLLGVAVALSAVSSHVLRSLDVPGWIYIATIAPTVIVFAARWACLQSSRRLFAVSAVIGNLLYAVAVMKPDPRLNSVLALLWLLLFPFIVATGAGWVEATGEVDAPRRPSRLAWPMVILAALLPGITLATSWPLRLAFLVTRPTFERLADAASGGTLALPAVAGPFRLIGSDAHANGVVGLYTDSSPGGRTGFVRDRRPSSRPGDFGPLFGTDMNVDLGWGWSYRQDD